MNVLCVRMRFHSHHGSNIELDEGGVVASRKSSFANALAFSERPLDPGEIFLIQIEENESGWSGYVRLGLTQKNPDSHFDLPLYALPDLIPIGPSWACAITKTAISASIKEQVDAYAQAHPGGDGEGAVLDPDEDLDESEQNLVNYSRIPRVIHREGTMIRTPRGIIHENTLLPYGGKGEKKSEAVGGGGGVDADSQIPTDIGSRIGVMFVPTSSTKAAMHFIINGEDQGPSSVDIPFTEAPLYAVVDVYGTTKRVRIVHYDGVVESLQSLCRNVILKSIKTSGVSNLPLPTILKNYLLFCR